MDTESSVPIPPLDPALNLGISMGRRRALCAISARCSAGHATTLRNVRDQKLYLPLARTWEEFCGIHTSITRRHADRLIGLLNEFGPTYFDLAELTGITPDQYRQIQPLIQQQGVDLDGDPVFLIPDTARPIHLAVRQLLQQAEAAAVPVRKCPAPTPLATLTRRGNKLVAAFQRLLQHTHLSGDRTAILETIRNTQQALERIH